MKKALVIVAVLVGLAILAAISENRSGDGDDFTAYLMSQKFVAKKLRAPSTARFCPFEETTVGHEPGGSYKVSGCVDAQNAFGAMLRNRFVCRLRPVGNSKWESDEVTLLP